MTKVTCDIAMSIDGYVAGPNQSRTYAGGVERGERNVSLLNIARLAGARETSPANLVGRTR
jgi:hypothetical protein